MRSTSSSRSVRFQLLAPSGPFGDCVRGFWDPLDENPPVVSAICVPRPGRYIRGHYVAQPLRYLGPRRWWQPLVPAYNLANLMQVLCVHGTQKSKIGRLVLRQPSARAWGATG